MIPWLYRYIFKGIGFAFLIGVITIAYVSYQEGAYLAAQKHAAKTAPAKR